MAKAFIISLLAVAFFSAKDVRTVTVPQLKQVVQKQDDTLYVVNFWATWCKPCVGEMPYFENANAKFKSEKVKVVFVSLNSQKELPVVKKFTTDKQIQSDVLLLNGGNPNVWIDSIDNTWSGAIPATAIYRNGKKVFFYEGEFTQALLDSIIQTKNKLK